MAGATWLIVSLWMIDLSHTWGKSFDIKKKNNNGYLSKKKRKKKKEKYKKGTTQLILASFMNMNVNLIGSSRVWGKGLWDWKKKKEIKQACLVIIESLLVFSNIFNFHLIIYTWSHWFIDVKLI